MKYIDAVIACIYSKFCYISLLVYRLLEQKLKKNDGTPDYTCRQILDTLSDMKVTLLTKDSDYIPSYKRTDLTDHLHQTFGFRTDNEFITKSRMRSIIKNTKLRTEKKKI